MSDIESRIAEVLGNHRTDITAFDRHMCCCGADFGKIADSVGAHLVADLTAVLERVEKLAEKWRYKGEFGWGPWQEGYGPDHEGHILDQASAELRDALEGK